MDLGVEMSALWTMILQNWVNIGNCYFYPTHVCFFESVKLEIGVLTLLKKQQLQLLLLCKRLQNDSKTKIINQPKYFAFKFFLPSTFLTCLFALLFALICFETIKLLFFGTKLVLHNWVKSISFFWTWTWQLENEGKLITGMVEIDSHLGPAWLIVEDENISVPSVNQWLGGGCLGMNQLKQIDCFYTRQQPSSQLVFEHTDMSRRASIEIKISGWQCCYLCLYIYLETYWDIFLRRRRSVRRANGHAWHPLGSRSDGRKALFYHHRSRPQTKMCGYFCASPERGRMAGSGLLANKNADEQPPRACGLKRGKCARHVETMTVNIWWDAATEMEVRW